MTNVFFLCGRVLPVFLCLGVSVKMQDIQFEFLLILKLDALCL